jgi:hypothetical protein
MVRADFLTRRWNNIITLVQGLPTFLFIIYGVATPLGDTKGGMIALSIIGAVY